MMAVNPVSSLVVVLLIGYLAFSIWNAYAAGCNKGMMRKNKVKGVIRIGPHLSLFISYMGVAIVVFLALELTAYYTGFLRINLSAALANLDFFEFLIKQFTSVNLAHIRYVFFLALGVALSAVTSYLTIKVAYDVGLKKTGR